MKLIKAGVSTHQAGRPLAGEGLSVGAAETQAPATGLEAQLEAVSWGQRCADRLLKGQVFADLLTLWVYVLD